MIIEMSVKRYKGCLFFEDIAVDITERQCTADLLQSRKPMGADLSDKTAGSIISVLLVSVTRGKNL